MESVVTVCSYSILFLENLIIIYNCMTILKYKFKNILLGCLYQEIFLLGLDIIRDYAITLFVNPFFLIFLMQIITYIMICILYRGSAKRKLFALGLYLIPAYLGEIVALLVMKQIAVARAQAWIDAYPAFYMFPEYKVFGYIFCAQTILCFWGIGTFIWRYIETHIWVKEYIIFVILGVYQEILLIIYYSQSEELTEQKVYTGLLFFTLGFVLEIGTIYLVNRMVKKVESERKLSRLYQQRELELRYYDDINRHMEEIRMLRHEYANQLQVIYDLLDNHCEEKAEEMIQMIYENVERRGM